MTSPSPAIPDLGSLIMIRVESSETRPLPRPLLGSSWSHHITLVTGLCIVTCVTFSVSHLSSHPDHLAPAPGVSWSLHCTPGCWQLTAPCQAHQARPLASQHSSLQTRGQCVAIQDVTLTMIGPASNTEARAGQWRGPTLRLLPSLY